jgi:hypothetical protein
VQTYRLGDTALRFANVFAANDPESTTANIDRLVVTGAIQEPFWVLINCRPDRIERNRQMGVLIGSLNADRVILIGGPTRTASAAIPRGWPGEILDLGGDRTAEDIFRRLVEGVSGDVSVVAIGNIHGQGELLLEHLELLGDLR